jgi:hypothetical protein
MFVSRLWLCGLLLVSLAFAGCAGDGGPPDRQPTKPVKVTVSYKGAPLAGANVSFIPAGEGQRPAYGRTDDAGVAKMKTYVEGDGAVVGQHKVLIEKSESVGGQNVDQDSPEYNPNAPPPTTKYLIPKKYSDYANSGLSAEVKDSGPNEFAFDLKD